jgi:hypothetical protein
VAARFESESDTKRDIDLLCNFWKRLREIEAPSAHVLRGQILSLVQETRSASTRLLDGSAALLESVALKPHEKFELALLSAIIGSCIESFDILLEKLGKKLEPLESNASPEDAAEREKLLRDRIENLSNLQINFLIGA